jgi:hypothetical protein
LGSVVVGVALSKPPPDAGSDIDQVTFDRLAQGLAEAQEREGLPAGWTTDLATKARDLIKDANPEGIFVEIQRDGVPVRSVRVTRAAQRNIEAGLDRGWQDSIGSLIGRLDSVTVHDKYEARLWPESEGPSVPVRFTRDQMDVVRNHLGARVEASGWLRRDAADRPIQLRLGDIERLSTFEESPPLVGLIGLDPGFTGGKSAVEYLKEIRGEAQ